MTYVLTMWNAEKDSHELVLNGPFATEEAAGEWGTAWGNANGDNPMWQVVIVPSTEVAVRPV